MKKSIVKIVLASFLLGTTLNSCNAVKNSNNTQRGATIGAVGGAIIGGVLYYPIGILFTKDPEVLAEFYNVFWLILAMQPICAIAFIFDGMFKGLGKMKTLRNVLLFSTFIVFVPILFWLDSLEYKLYAIFIALTFWMIARGLPLIIKFRKLFLPLSQNN